jgi:uncharacterized protein YcfJ
MAETMSPASDAGRTAGTVVGLLTGAQWGTTAIPVPFVGTLVGAVVGGMVGNEAGGFVARAILTVAGGIVQATSNVTGRAAHGIRSVGNAPVASPAPVP